MKFFKYINNFVNSYIGWWHLAAMLPALAVIICLFLFEKNLRHAYIEHLNNSEAASVHVQHENLQKLIENLPSGKLKYNLEVVMVSERGNFSKELSELLRMYLQFKLKQMSPNE